MLLLEAAQRFQLFGYWFVGHGLAAAPPRVGIAQVQVGHDGGSRGQMYGDTLRRQQPITQDVHRWLPPSASYAAATTLPLVSQFFGPLPQPFASNSRQTARGDSADGSAAADAPTHARSSWRQRHRTIRGEPHGELGEAGRNRRHKPEFYRRDGERPNRVPRHAASGPKGAAATSGPSGPRPESVPAALRYLARRLLNPPRNWRRPTRLAAPQRSADLPPRSGRASREQTPGQQPAIRQRGPNRTPGDGQRRAPGRRYPGD